MKFQWFFFSFKLFQHNFFLPKEIDHLTQQMLGFLFLDANSLDLLLSNFFILYRSIL